MSKQARQVKDAKRRRSKDRAAARAARGRIWPYVSIAGAAAGIIGAFFLISAGGGSSGDVASAYPAGYTPPVQGDASAPVEIVMFGDFQCPSCKRFETDVLPQLRNLYVDQGKVRFVWRNFEHYGDESVAAATGAHCAGEQGKFWEYRAGLFEAPRVTEDLHQQLGESLGLDLESFQECLASEKYRQAVEGDSEEAARLGITGTPAFLVNGILISGARPLDAFSGIIDRELQAAKRPVASQ